MAARTPLFDRIRIRRAEDPTAKPQERHCDHAGCANAGVFRAPKGRGREGQFYFFCLDHVRAYNQSYNYFSGMQDAEVAAYQRDALTGHRPTWPIGVKGARRPAAAAYSDPFDVFGLGGFNPAGSARAEEKPRIQPMALKAFDVLSLEPTAQPQDIKNRYKELVKRLHPDANGGDRSREGILQDVIKAYNTLRSLGYC
jgi:hypothetical protein